MSPFLRQSISFTGWIESEHIVCGGLIWPTHIVCGEWRGVPQPIGVLAGKSFPQKLQYRWLTPRNPPQPLCRAMFDPLQSPANRQAEPCLTLPFGLTILLFQYPFLGLFMVIHLHGELVPVFRLDSHLFPQHLPYLYGISSP
jgi:hypothetical protein